MNYDLNSKQDIKLMIKDTGMKHNWIAERIVGVDKSILSHYLSDRADLNPEQLRKFNRYIASLYSFSQTHQAI